VADQAKPDKAAEPADAASISPAPTEVAGDPKDQGKGNPPPPNADSKVQATPLSDGTTPTVLATGDGHRSVAKGKASITRVYRRADILTTLVTFAGALVAGAIVIGIYFFTTQKTAKPATTPKVSALSQSDVDKLSSFFDGNTAGNSSEVLTVSASSLFKGRVAVASDLKVVGGTSISGTTALSDLTVDKTSTLGVTNIRGQLTVAGPTAHTGPVTFAGGQSTTGNIAATGNGTFGGSLSAGTLSVRDLSVSGNFNLAGHLNMSGSTPGVSAGANITGADVSGNDSAGTVVFSASATVPAGSKLVSVTFRNPFPRTPKIVLSPDSANSAELQYYVLKFADHFDILSANAAGTASTGTNYAFDYWAVQ
jgi:hypothetical protein